MMPIKSIFLIEDDADDQDVFMEALNCVNQEVQCLTASDGFEALEKLNSKTFPRPDLIVLDLNMPRMNGKQFLEIFRQDNQFNHIPVVIYSTSSESKYIDEIMALGAQHFFRKPNTFSELCEQISLSVIKD